MHVTRVELDNIKAYEHAEYTFARGTIAIVGPNGAGKTTILEAIAWALFDTLEYSKDDFLRRGAKKGSVRITFESDLDGREYTVYRDTGQGYYVFDPGLGVRLAEKKTDVRAFLSQHLGIEPGTDLKALFRSAIGVPQGLLTADFREPLSERKAKFDRLLKVEEYREGARRLGDTVKLIAERSLEVHKRIANAEGQLASYDRLVAEYAEATNRVEALEAQLLELQREADERATAVAELDEAERRVVETRAQSERSAVELSAAERRLADLQTELEAAARAVERQRATESDYQEHVAALERLRALEAERTERDRLLGELRTIERSIVEAKSELRRLADLLERIAEARASLVALESDIGAQESLERERERQRDLLARSRAAGERLARLERELESLRAQHTQTRERVRAAESAAGADERAERLESERVHAETQLSRLEQALATRKVLEKQRREQAREIERVRRSVVALERETRELEHSSEAARQLTELETRERELARDAARLRAAIEHDERVRAETKTGVCPILGDRCLSFSEGQTFESYFGDQLKAYRAELSSVEREGERVVAAVRQARTAATAAAQLEREQKRLVEERAQLARHEERLAVIDEELTALSAATPEQLDALQTELLGIDGMLRGAREEARRYAELEPLRVRLQEIAEEGKRKRDERDELAAVTAGVASLTAEISETEERLRALDDPRGRAAGLRVEVAREDAFKREAERARAALSSLEEQKCALDHALRQFSALDAEWTESTRTRERTSASYREYLTSAELAATLPARRTEHAAARERTLAATRADEAARADFERALGAYDRERHSYERGQLSLVRERSAATSAQLETARERSAALGDDIARLDLIRDTLRDEFRAKERLEELHEATDFIRDTLKAAGPLVTESYLYNISIEANQLFREITDEGARSLRWTKDYEIILEEGGYERSFINLSGGEQVAAALSVRLALLKQLSDIRIAFFDEPTVNMDHERRQNLARQIGQVRDFDQLFVISHDDTFEESVDHTINVARETENAVS